MAIGIVAILGGIITTGFIFYLLKISLFSQYGDLHFNRKTAKIYACENKIAVQMDWQYVRPYALLGFGPPQLGGGPLMSLMLVEHYPGQPAVWKSRMTVAGPLPNRHGCQQVWEMIRRYMEDTPATLPEVEVVPGRRNWIGALIEFGPLTDQLDGVPEIIGKLRARNWWPPINILTIVLWILTWPSPLSSTLYARFRPQPKLPTEWTKDETPLPGETNPYRITAEHPNEARGRKKAAMIIGITCSICILIGMAMWGFGIYQIGKQFLGNS